MRLQNWEWFGGESRTGRMPQQTTLGATGFAW